MTHAISLNQPIRHACLTRIVFGSIAALCLGPGALAQATLPGTAPTQLVQPTQPIQTARPTPSASPRHLQVLYNSGLLTVHAENASLNGILREISRLTGMSVTGGVLDERVYGNYGPADTGTVLDSLLAGTGSNMLLQESTADRPLTLILTPRQGGPTPPSPSSVTPDLDADTRPEQADLPPQQTRPTPRTGAPPTGNTPNGYSPSAASQDTPASGNAPPTTPAGTDGSTSPAPPSNTTDQQSPNGVKTPQQIYDQLMQLKQQQIAKPQ